MASWSRKTLLVTGGAGFLGSHLLNKLIKEMEVNPDDIRIPRSSTEDLRNWENCVEVVKGVDVVFHLAARVGGIGYNRLNPATIFYDNVVMGAHLTLCTKL